jgi:hypothetical protein
MEYEGMVRALEEIHRLLKPTGVLIDLHPVAESSPVETHHGGKIDLAGNLSVRQWCIDYQQADNALAEIVQRGLFAIERGSVFDSLTHYASVAEMRTSLRESIDKFARDSQSVDEAAPHAEALAARADELIRAAAISESGLIIRERTHISRLMPMRG